jgi:hypothetical protein
MVVNCLRPTTVVLIKNYNMDLLFDIQTIKFNSLSDWLILNGTLKQGALSSEMFLKVEQSFLNKILNQLQGENPNTSINDYLKSYQDVNINDYEFDLKTMENTSIPMEEIKWLTSTEEYKFIRA